MARPTILALNLTDERQSKLRFICMKLGLLMKTVPAEDFHQPIGALCGLLPRAEGAAEASFADELLVFCHMSSMQVNRFLQTARQMRFAPVALKAVLTPTNVNWTAQQLHAELREERQAILRGGAASHTEE